MHIRVSKVRPGPDQGPALVMEAAPYTAGDTGASVAHGPAPGDWFQVRIASLRSGSKPWRMGFFSISPVAQEGSEARFHYVELGPKVAPVHGSDAGIVTVNVGV